LKRSFDSVSTTTMKPRLRKVPFTISWIFAGVNTIGFSTPGTSLLSIGIEPITVLSRSFVPEAPAVCQLTPVAETFHVICVSLKAVFNRYTRMVRLLLERSEEIHRESVAELIIAFAGMDDRSNLIKLRAVRLFVLLSSPTPISVDVPKLEVFDPL
jgi:hypothetical protein